MDGYRYLSFWSFRYIFQLHKREEREGRKWEKDFNVLFCDFIKIINIIRTMTENKTQLVQCFGRKKNAVAVAAVKAGKGVFRVNGSPIELLEPQSLRVKVLEPILLLGLKRFQNLDVRIRVRGGGYVAQIYAIRQALSKGVVAYYQKYVNETEKREIKELLLQYDRSLLVADPRRCEPKKYGGPGARARYQKSYRWSIYCSTSLSIPFHLNPFQTAIYDLFVNATRYITESYSKIKNIDLIIIY